MMCSFLSPGSIFLPHGTSKRKKILLKMQIMWTLVTQVNQTIQSARQGNVNFSEATRSPDIKGVTDFPARSTMQK